MSQQQINGHANAAEATPQQNMERAQAQLEALLEPIIGTTINGSLVTIQGCAPEHIARAIARVTGKVLGRIVQQGPLPAVLQVRAGMKEGFSKAMDSVTPVPPPANGGIQRPQG